MAWTARTLLRLSLAKYVSALHLRRPLLQPKAHHTQVPYLNEAENLLFYSYWTFTDIFEEGGQLSEPWSNSFGMQTIHQVDSRRCKLFLIASVVRVLECYLR